MNCNVNSRAATKRSVASIQVNTGTIYQLVQVDDEYRYECLMCTGTACGRDGNRHLYEHLMETLW